MGFCVLGELGGWEVDSVVDGGVLCIWNKKRCKLEREQESCVPFISAKSLIVYLLPWSNGRIAAFQAAGTGSTPVGSIFIDF